MAGIPDLKEALTQALEHQGVLNELRSRLRSEIFHALDEKEDQRPPLSNENLLINELICEYLEFNKYKSTQSVLMAESGQPAESLDRRFLASELNLNDSGDSGQLPLLYKILAMLVTGAHLPPPSSSSIAAPSSSSGSSRSSHKKA